MRCCATPSYTQIDQEISSRAQSLEILYKWTIPHIDNVISRLANAFERKNNQPNTQFHFFPPLEQRTLLLDFPYHNALAFIFDFFAFAVACSLPLSIHDEQ